MAFCVYFYQFSDTPPNPWGICELCAHENSFLAYPGSVQTGEIQIFDACNLQAITMITAHSGRIAALKFNMDGSKLATASEKVHKFAYIVRNYDFLPFTSETVFQVRY